ncbi:MAG: N-acetylmuramoyl-L-alanine amidase [Allobaculum sp.]|nr:N-acetylmuramoyl-L-alanine amidase [Allobaculum sp.]
MPDTAPKRLRLSIRFALYAILLTGLSLGIYQGIFTHYMKNTQSTKDTLAYALNGEPHSSLQQEEWPSFSFSFLKLSSNDTSSSSQESQNSSLYPTLENSINTISNATSESLETVESMESHASLSEPEKIVYTKTILLDAGHGGIDLGQTALDGTMEKDITLSLAQKIKKNLEAANPNLQVLMVRESNQLDNEDNKIGWEDLVWRRQQQEAANADYFLSIHTCESIQDESGYAFYLNPDDSISSIWVNAMQDNLQENGWGSARAIVTTDQYPLQLISMASSHAVQIDLGSMSDAQDLARFQSEESLEKAASAIASAISTTIQENPEAPGYVSRQEIIEQKTLSLASQD